MSKISIRLFDDPACRTGRREVRAVWDEENAKWWFSMLDRMAVHNDQDDHLKTRNYWKYLKAKLKRENSEVVSTSTQWNCSRWQPPKTQRHADGQLPYPSSKQILVTYYY